MASLYVRAVHFGIDPCRFQFHMAEQNLQLRHRHIERTGRIYPIGGTYFVSHDDQADADCFDLTYSAALLSMIIWIGRPDDLSRTIIANATLVGELESDAAIVLLGQL